MVDEIEMAAYAWIAWRLTHRYNPAHMLRISARVAQMLSRFASRTGADPDRAAKLAWRWVRIASRGRGDCYDRAVAARWWLARRGEHVHVVIGVRKGEGGEMQGHAWIEDGSGEAYLVEPGAGYREVERG